MLIFALCLSLTSGDSTFLAFEGSGLGRLRGRKLSAIGPSGAKPTCSSTQPQRLTQGLFPQLSCNFFYTGVPLVTPEGHALGSFCVIHRKPRKMTPTQKQSLLEMGSMVVSQLVHRRDEKLLNQASMAKSTTDKDIGKGLKLLPQDVTKVLQAHQVRSGQSSQEAYEEESNAYHHHLRSIGSS